MADDQYEDLIRHLRALALSQHDDVSIAADAAGAIIALLAERDVLLHERDALAKDAARYRWLRDGAYHLIEPDRGLGPTIPCGDEMDIAVDAAIDAAMAGREGEK